MRRLEIDNVEVMLEKEVSDDGRVFGLKDWAGEKVIVIITKKEKLE